MPRKPEARAQALKLYIESKGKATHKDLAEAVGVTTWTVGQWSRAENWKLKIDEVKAPPVVKRRKKAEVEKAALAVSEMENVETAEDALAPKKRKSRAGVLLKKDVFDRAAKIFLESGGDISNTELGKRVKVSAATIASWKKMPQWSESVVVASTEPVESAPAPKKRKRAGGPAIRKKGLFDQAARIFQESGGKIPNVELGRRVNVTDTTIAKWKKMPQWSEAVAVEATEPVEVPPVVEEVPVPEVAPVAEIAPAPHVPTPSEVAAVDVEAITALQDLVTLNERLRSMLSRDFLTASEIEHLANAKLSLLEAAEVYLGMVKGSGE